MPFLRTWTLFACLALASAFASTAHGKSSLVPMEIPGVILLSSRDLAALMFPDALQTEDNLRLFVIDVRRRLEFAEEHIPSALWIPYQENSSKQVSFNPRKDSFDLESIRKLKPKALVFYCNGPECWRSYKACLAVQRARIKVQIYWLREGLPGWKQENFPTAAGIE